MDKNIRFSRLYRISSYISAVLLAGYIIFSIVALIILPDTIPMHFNGNGEVNRYGSKYESIIVNIIVLILYFSFSVLVRNPEIFNLPAKLTELARRRQEDFAIELLGIMRLEFVVVFASLEVMTFMTGMNYTSGLSKVFLPIMLGVLVITLVVYVIRMLRSPKS